MNYAGITLLAGRNQFSQVGALLRDRGFTLSSTFLRALYSSVSPCLCNTKAAGRGLEKEKGRKYNIYSLNMVFKERVHIKIVWKIWIYASKIVFSGICS